ncbi:MAG TPA: hypothetical protein VGE07_21280 [Herpetosiphonaceae bacterium]
MTQPQTIEAAAAAPCQACIDACLDCHAVCMDAALRCLQADPAADAGLVRMLLDCAELCRTNAELMRADDDLLEETCMACGILYEHFARECDLLAGDPVLRRCAEAIRACVEACENLVMAA